MSEQPEQTSTERWRDNYESWGLPTRLWRGHPTVVFDGSTTAMNVPTHLGAGWWRNSVIGTGAVRCWCGSRAGRCSSDPTCWTAPAEAHDLEQARAHRCKFGDELLLPLTLDRDPAHPWGYWEQPPASGPLPGLSIITEAVTVDAKVSDDLTPLPCGRLWERELQVSRMNGGNTLPKRIQTTRRDEHEWSPPDPRLLERVAAALRHLDHDRVTTGGKRWN